MEKITISRTANHIRYNKHSKRKNNDIVAAMYAMYQTGRSLADIALVYKRSRQAVYDVFKSRNYSLRSKQLKGLQIIDGFKFTETKGGYLRGTVNGERILMHQYIWKKYHGEIPEGSVIHHKDNNPANNKIENLELIRKEDMSIVFNPKGNNQYSKIDKSIL